MKKLKQKRSKLNLEYLSHRYFLSVLHPPFNPSSANGNVLTVTLQPPRMAIWKPKADTVKQKRQKYSYIFI